MMLDLTSLASALSQLDIGLAEVDARPDLEPLHVVVTRHFESSHELAITFIRRTLEHAFGVPVDQMPYDDVLQTAFEHELIENVNVWFLYREACKRVADIEEVAIAPAICRFARLFLRDGQILLSRLHAVLSSDPA